MISDTCKWGHSLADAYVLGTGKRRCRQCHSVRGKRYYEQNREHVLERQRRADQRSKRKHRSTQNGTPRQRKIADACVICTTVCAYIPLHGWYCKYHGIVNVYDPNLT